MSRLERIKELDERIKHRFRHGAHYRLGRVMRDKTIIEAMAVDFILVCLIAVSLYIYFDKNVNIIPAEMKIPFPFNVAGVVFLVALAVLIHWNYRYIRLKLLLKKASIAAGKRKAKKK